MTRIFAPSIVAALCMVTSASARDLLEWGATDGWNIFVNPAAGDGCMMERQFGDGTLFQLGAIPAENGGFFAAYNRDWTWIEDGAEGDISFQFDDKRFGGQAIGKVSGDWYGAFAFFNNPNLAYDFAKKKTVTISGGEDRSVEIDLTGSMEALDLVITCQSEQG